MDTENPFWVVDITCTANPHCTAVTKRELSALNNLYDHTLKLFTANLKHYIRGTDCYDDIAKMYRRICGQDTEVYGEEQMLNVVFEWLAENAENRHKKYIALLGNYI